MSEDAERCYGNATEVAELITKRRPWFYRARRILRSNPRLRALLLPSWIWLHHMRWRARNLLTRRRPISVLVNDHTVRFHPDGQISEALYTGGFEEVERDFVATFLEPGMCVVDAGANVGFYTVLASALVGPTGQVHAFEPSATTCALLVKNLELNGCANVKTSRLALSNSNKNMVLRADPNHPSYDAHRFVDQTDRVDKMLSTDETVACVMLDDYLLKERVRQVDFMKVDVEGAELLVLQGARILLERPDDLTLMMECIRNEVQVANLLTAYGYHFFIWEMGGRNLRQVSFDQARATGSIIARRHTWNP